MTFNRTILLGRIEEIDDTILQLHKKKKKILKIYNKRYKKEGEKILKL
tara:strand:- start:162 stop:305 length:144 start_codon:yes stop_codon:yes gene_type:complete